MYGMGNLWLNNEPLIERGKTGSLDSMKPSQKSGGCDH